MSTPDPLARDDWPDVDERRATAIELADLTSIDAPTEAAVDRSANQRFVGVLEHVGDCNREILRRAGDPDRKPLCRDTHTRLSERSKAIAELIGTLSNRQGVRPGVLSFDSAPILDELPSRQIPTGKIRLEQYLKRVGNKCELVVYRANGEVLLRRSNEAAEITVCDNVRPHSRMNVISVSTICLHSARAA